MRSRIIVLLAVCSNVAAAGPLRHNGARVPHHNVARFLNHTETPSIRDDIQTSTPTPITSSSIIPLIAASPETSAFVATSSTIPAARPSTLDEVSSSSPATDALTVSTSSQVLSKIATQTSILSTTAVPEHSEASSGTTPASTSSFVYGGSLNGENYATAVVQSAETLSRLFNPIGSPPNDVQSFTNAPSFSSTPSPILSASTPTISYVRSTMATPSSSSVRNQAPTSSEAAVPLSSPAAYGQGFSSSITTILTSSPATASQTPSQVVVPVPVSSGVVQVLGAGGDTADEFAPVTLDSSSPAPTGTAKYPTAAGGNTAMAVGFNEVYKTLKTDTACNPADPSQAYACVEGEIAECQSDETYVLKSCPRGQTCYALPKPTGLIGVVVQCAVPSDATAALDAVTLQPTQMLQAEADLSQTTQSVSAQNPVQPVTSSSSVQTIIQSPTMAPASSEPAATRAYDSAVSTGTSSISAQSAFQSQTQTLNPSVFSLTATAQQVHDSNPLNNSPMSDTSSPAPTTTAAVYSIPDALFAVVTAVGSVPVSPSESSGQTLVSPAPQTSQPPPVISTPVIQSSVVSPQASPDSLQVMEASVSSTPTTSANGAGTTFAPMGVAVNEKAAVGNGQATVTVTVTVTTTETSPVITVSAS